MDAQPARECDAAEPVGCRYAKMWQLISQVDAVPPELPNSEQCDKSCRLLLLLNSVIQSRIKLLWSTQI